MSTTRDSICVFGEYSSTSVCGTDVVVEISIRRNATKRSKERVKYKYNCVKRIDSDGVISIILTMIVRKAVLLVQRTRQRDT